jgi:hypothetical protein
VPRVRDGGGAFEVTGERVLDGPHPPDLGPRDRRCPEAQRRHVTMLKVAGVGRVGRDLSLPAACNST